MVSWVQRLPSIRSCDCKVSNEGFDAIILAASLACVYFQKQGSIIAGLDAFVFSSFADRAIKWICTDDFGIPVDSEEQLTPEMLKGVVAVGLEELVYSYVLLNSQQGLFFTALRGVASFALSLAASRSLRHADPKQDLWDAALGIGWTMGREIVIRKVPSVALVFSIVSNSYIFGLNERMKFREKDFRAYKLASGIALRVLWSCYAASGDQNLSIAAPLIAHTLFNISRCLPAMSH